MELLCHELETETDYHGNLTQLNMTALQVLSLQWPGKRHDIPSLPYRSTIGISIQVEVFWVMTPCSVVAG